MFNLSIDENVFAKLSPYFKDEYKVILDIDDGVGQFAENAQACSMDTAFRIILVDKKLDTPEYGIVIKSNLGDVYAKTGTEYSLSKEMTLKYTKPFNQLALRGKDGTLDDNMQVLNKVSK